jgi:hypothetical protein
MDTAPTASRVEDRYIPTQVLQNCPSLVAAITAMTIEASSGVRPARATNSPARRGAERSASNRYRPKAAKKAKAPTAKMAIGTPPHSSWRNSAEYGLYMAARQPSSAPCLAVTPGMKLQLMSWTWRSRWLT